MAAYPMPLVIAPRRTIVLAGERLAQDRLVVEMQRQSLADVRSMLRGITRVDTAQQIALGNPPTVIEVDASRNGKQIEAAERKTVVIFGSVLAASAMREVEAALAAAIANATTPHSGRLGAVSSSWQWLFIPKGRAALPVSSGTPPASFGVGDRLVLLPREVPYATLTNRNVARGGHLNVRALAGRWRKGRSPAKAKQNRGFLFWTAEAVRKHAAFKQFNVSVVFSKAHMVAGELMTRTQGTGMIVIRAKARVLRI
jgi:hypothetical protein